MRYVLPNELTCFCFSSFFVIYFIVLNFLDIPGVEVKQGSSERLKINSGRSVWGKDLQRAMLFKAYQQILEILQEALHSHTDDSLLFVTKRLYVFPFLLGLHFSVRSRCESFFFFPFCVIFVCISQSRLHFCTMSF